MLTQWESWPDEVPRGPLLHHPRPVRLHWFPDSPPSRIPRCCSSWWNASPPAAILWQVRTPEMLFFFLKLCRIWLWRVKKIVKLLGKHKFDFWVANKVCTSTIIWNCSNMAELSWMNEFCFKLYRHSPLDFAHKRACVCLHLSCETHTIL